MMSRSCDLIVSLAARPADPAGPADLGRLRVLPGVERVHLDQHQTWMLVTFDPEVIDDTAVMTTVTELGFRATAVHCYE